MNRNDQQFMAEKIRTQYMEKQSTELDARRALDAKVKRPANIFSYVFGSLGVLALGFGMSLFMSELGENIGFPHIASLIVGIFAGLLGGAFACLAYPVYNLVLRRERKKIAPEIIRLTDELMK